MSLEGQASGPPWTHSRFLQRGEIHLYIGIYMVENTCGIGLDQKSLKKRYLGVLLTEMLKGFCKGVERALRGKPKPLIIQYTSSLLGRLIFISNCRFETVWTVPCQGAYIGITISPIPLGQHLLD